MINFGRAAFRANPRYTLVVLDRLSCAERQLADGAAGEANRYGVLRPQPDSGLELRSASADTALLFLTLAKPGPLPEYFVTRLGDEAERTIGRLVLDSVLEIEHRGQYLCGLQAGELVAPGHSDAGRGRIGKKKKKNTKKKKKKKKQINKKEKTNIKKKKINKKQKKNN